MDVIRDGASQAQMAVALSQKQQADVGGQITASKICGGFATGKR